MKLIIALLCSSILAGCSTYQGVVGQYATDKSRQAADAADFQLKAAVWLLCDVASQGSVRRALPEESDHIEYINTCYWLNSRIRTE